MKTICLFCIALIVLSFGCTSRMSGFAANKAVDEKAVEECKHYRTCYVEDLVNTSACMRLERELLKEKIPQLQRVAILQKCLLDKDKMRDECYGSDSDSVRLSKIEKCKQIGIDPTKPIEN